MAPGAEGGMTAATAETTAGGAAIVGSAAAVIDTIEEGFNTDGSVRTDSTKLMFPGVNALFHMSN